MPSSRVGDRRFLGAFCGHRAVCLKLAPQPDGDDVTAPVRKAPRQTVSPQEGRAVARSQLGALLVVVLGSEDIDLKAHLFTFGSRGVVR